MINGETPLISVLLPVYNAEKYIGETIASVLAQSYTNWELIAIDDGSKDKSAEIIEQCKDPRIRLYRQENSGMGATLNKAIAIAKGKYLARQDADDISLPERFERQVDFLEDMDNYAMVGTWAAIIDDNGRLTGRMHKHPEMSSQLRFELLFDNPFVHSSVMIRNEALAQTGMYDLSKNPLIQDYELWWRIAQKFQVGNIAETLVYYREVGSSMSRTANKFGEIVAQQSFENILSLFKRAGQVLTENELRHLKELCLVYHSCNSALVKQPREKDLINIARRIEAATNQFTMDYDRYDVQFFGRRLGRSWRSYRIDHPDTPALKRFILRIARRLNS